MAIGEDNQMVVLAVVLIVSGTFLIISRYCSKTRPTLQRRSKKALLEKREYVNSHVKGQKVSYLFFPLDYFCKCMWYYKCPIS